MGKLPTGLLLGMLVTAACKDLIGIQDATLDPTLGNAGSVDDPGVVPMPATGGGGSGGPGSTGSGGSGTPGGEAHASGAAGEPPLDAMGGFDAGAGGVPSMPTLCESYCDAVEANCTDTLAIYTSRKMCLAVCAVMQPGLPGDRELEVDSVHCRLEAAQAAGESEPEYSCPIAAPGGNGGCGSNCANLCSLREQVCSAWVTGDSAACLDACSKLADLGSYTIHPAAMPSNTRGGHVQCRLYHVSAAATDEPDTHCLHADGASPCIDR